MENCKIKYRDIMVNKITITPKGEINIVMSDKDTKYEDVILEYATNMCSKMKNRISQNLKIKVKINSEGKVFRVKSPFLTYDGTALVFAMEVK